MLTLLVKKDMSGTLGAQGIFTLYAGTATAPTFFTHIEGRRPENPPGFSEARGSPDTLGLARASQRPTRQEQGG